MPATPRCPYCNAQGLNHLALHRLDGFGLVYCGNCGAIYGVVPLSSTDRLSKSTTQSVVPPAPPVEVEKPAVPFEPETKSPPPEIEPAAPPIIAAPLASKPPTGALEEVGSTDLSHKLPYDPEAIANRMRVAGTGQGSRFLKVAVDVGPPLCPQHKIEMIQSAIPHGYQNAGREVWLCPHFKSCHQWELAK